MRSPLTMLRLTYPRVPSPKTVTSFQRVRSTHSPLLSRRLKLEATLTRSVEPTCLISPTRPMIVNSAIVFMGIHSFFQSLPRAFGSCRRSLRGAAHKKPGEAGQHPRGTSGPERQAEDGGGRRFCLARNSAVCAWHGHWIGGESPSRGEMVATASQRQLHAVVAVVRRRPWRREAVWGRSPRRTAAPNER